MLRNNRWCWETPQTYFTTPLGWSVNAVSVEFHPRSQKGNSHSLDSNSAAILNDDFVDLGVAGEVQVRVDGAGGVDVGMGAVAATASLDVSYFVSGGVHGFEQVSRLLTSRLIHLSLEDQSTLCLFRKVKVSSKHIPLLSTVAGAEILQVVDDRNSLAFGSSEEVVFNWVHTAERSASVLS